jgi:hypothetical protein
MRRPTVVSPARSELVADRAAIGGSVLASVLISIGALLSGATAALGHDNAVVHRRMAEESVACVDHAFYGGSNADVREGSYGEDVPATRSLGHFYNPETDSAPWFALGSGTAWQNSQDQYDAGLDEYDAGNLTGEDAAYYRIGRALHFIQDMTSVAHVHDDQHATDDEDFEDYGPPNFDSFDYSAVVPKFAGDPTAAGFVREIARLVYDKTIYEAELDAFDGCPSACQPPSLLRDMFPSLHYEDGGFFDGDVWVIDRIGPTDTFGGLSDGWWIVDENKIEDNGGRGGSSRIRGGAYVENTGGDGGEPIPLVFDGSPNVEAETLLHLYARLLYPEAVAYGAGLLQVFADEATGATPTPTPTATPSPTPTPTPSPVVTPTPSPTPTATPPPPLDLCGAAPRLDCRESTRARGSLLQVQDGPGMTRDRLLWRMSSGEATPIAALGDPFLGLTSYRLCLYDETSGGPFLASEAELPAGDYCRGKACWKRLPNQKGFVYGDADRTPDGVAKLVLKTGTEGKAKLILKAQGSRFAVPTLPFEQAPRVTVQLLNSEGSCWSATFGVPALQNDTAGFKDFSD